MLDDKFAALPLIYFYWFTEYLRSIAGCRDKRGTVGVFLLRSASGDTSQVGARLT
jgi:hypothetical protein